MSAIELCRSSPLSGTDLAVTVTTKNALVLASSSTATLLGRATWASTLATHPNRHTLWLRSNANLTVTVTAENVLRLASSSTATLLGRATWASTLATHPSR